MLKIIALVPLRHQSQRVLGNYIHRLVAKTLIHQIINQLLSYPEIDQDMVDTASSL